MKTIRHHGLPGIIALALLVLADTSLALDAVSGTVSDGQYITVPAGTTIDSWAILIAPTEMGIEEPNSEGDNSLLMFEVYVVQINDYTWRVVARYKYRWRTDYSNGYWQPGRANYLLVRKNP